MNCKHSYPSLEEPDEFDVFQIINTKDNDTTLEQTIKTVDKADIPFKN